MIFDWFSPRYSATLLAIATKVTGHLDEGCYTLIDDKTGSPLQRGAEARAYSIRCTFCRKTVARVPKRKGRRSMWSDELHAVQSKHITPCAIEALRDVMCRWSIGVATELECQAVRKLLADAAWSRDRGDLFHCEHEVVDRMLPSLPKPPHSLEARCLETGLALWARGKSVDWSKLEPLS